MPDEPTRQPEQLPTTAHGLIAVLAKLIVGLTTERALTLFVCAAMGVLLWNILTQTAENQGRSDRQHEESREADRKHCDFREERQRADNLVLVKAQQDSFRLMQKDLISHWAAECEKNRMVIVEAVKMEVARLVKNGTDPECSPAVAPAPKAVVTGQSGSQ